MNRKEMIDTLKSYRLVFLGTHNDLLEENEKIIAELEKPDRLDMVIEAYQSKLNMLDDKLDNMPLDGSPQDIVKIMNRYNLVKCMTEHIMEELGCEIPKTEEPKCDKCLYKEEG